MAQKKETYYDFYWKPCEPGLARFYSILEKTDSGWFRQDYFISSRRLQMKGLFRDSTCKVVNGTTQYYYANGIPSLLEKRIKGKKEGPSIRYYTNGMLADSGYYSNGKQVGIRMLWHRNGYPSDSLTRINDSTVVQVSWFDDGTPSAAGYLVLDKQQGKWRFYHHNGTLAGEEIYQKGVVTNKTYYNEDGSLQPDTAKGNQPVSFKKGGREGWQNYLRNNMTWPSGYKLVNTNKVTLDVLFCIDEEGKVAHAEVLTPFDPVFDKEALKIVERSPAWKPAIESNRKVKFWMRQPLTFQQAVE